MAHITNRRQVTEKQFTKKTITDDNDRKQFTNSNHCVKNNP
jgi:hypothetical protein